MSFFDVKGQSSVEYLSIVAIALMILVPGAYMFIEYSKNTSEQVTSSQLNLIGTTIINEAEKMYVLGENSWITLEVSFPGSLVDSVIVDGQEMYFSYVTSKGDAFVVFFPINFNISNSSDPCVGTCHLYLNPGVNNIRIQSRGEFSSIVKI